MKLEVYASSLFEQYCKRQQIKASWQYLSGQRKLVWLDEALYLMLTSIEAIKKSLKPLPKMQGQASYEMGYYNGLFQERQATITHLDSLVEALEAEYESLEEQLSK